MNNLIPQSVSVQINDLGLQFEDEVSFEQWKQVGEEVGRITRTSLFWIGDWLNYGQDRWNGGKRFERMSEAQRARYVEAMKLTGLEVTTLRGAAYVARQIPLERRSKHLSFEHHRLIARVKDSSERDDWIRKTEESSLSTRRLRKSINANRIVSDQELSQDIHRPRKGHHLWINRLVQWWANEQDDPGYEEMTREQIEMVIDDFAPVLGIVDQLRRRCENAESYLD